MASVRGYGVEVDKGAMGECPAPAHAGFLIVRLRQLAICIVDLKMDTLTIVYKFNT